MRMAFVIFEWIFEFAHLACFIWWEIRVSHFLNFIQADALKNKFLAEKTKEGKMEHKKIEIIF